MASQEEDSGSDSGGVMPAPPSAAATPSVDETAAAAVGSVAAQPPVDSVMFISSSAPVVRLHANGDGGGDAADAGAADGAPEKRKRLLGAASSVTAGKCASLPSASPANLKPCPEEGCSALSYTYLTWLNDLFRLGGHKTLEDSDVYAVRSDFAAAFVARLWREKWAEQLPIWQQEEKDRAAEAERIAIHGPPPAPWWKCCGRAKGKQQPSKAAVGFAFDTTSKITYDTYRLVYRTLHGMYGRLYWSVGLLKALYDGTNFVQPILLSTLVRHITDSQSDDPAEHPAAWRGYVIAVGMLLMAFLGLTLLNLHQRTTYGIGLRCRTALITALYRKSFRLSPAARAQLSTGAIVNMMSVDATMVDQAACWTHHLFSACLQLIVALALLLSTLGAPALVGVGVMLLFMPMQTYVMSGLRFARRHALQYTDKRIKFLSEVLIGIRVVKLYAWERSFSKAIAELRRMEMKYVRKAAFIRARNAIVTQMAPVLMSLGCFLVVGATSDDGLNAADVFSSVVYFNLLRMPLMQIPTVMNMIADAQIGMNRIQKFLLAEELSMQSDRLGPEQSYEEVARDRELIAQGKADPALEAAYRALTASSSSSSSASAASAPVTDPSLPPASIEDPFAIRIEHAEWSWDTLPDQVQDNKDEKGKGKAKGKDANRSGNTVEAKPLLAAANDNAASPRDGNGAAKAASAQSDAAAVDRVAPSVLHDITLYIPQGKLTIVCGAVGSGKSSLLSGLLGEMKKKQGRVSISGSVSYCSQQSWIMNANVRDNILFGRPFDQARYEETIRVCALTRDLRVLPDGDRTEIGEKGINLSGGQKQRVNLSRAYYFNSDIVLLDDPLSAVDAHVSKYLFQECLLGAMAGKTRVLVTHQLQYLPQADFIVFLKDGRVHECGSFASLMDNADSEVGALFREHGGGDNKETEGGEEQEEDEAAVEQAGAPTNTRGSIEKQQETAENEAVATVPVAPLKGAPRALMTVEERASGGLGLGVWLFYLEAFGGPWWCFFMVLSVLLQMGARLYNDMWLANWTDDAYDKSTGFYMAIYAGLGIAGCTGSALNITLFVVRGTEAARVIHDRSFHSLMRAPMEFFDTTPVGRVLNRFSRDQDVIDNSLPDSLRMLTFLLSAILGVLVLMCYVQPYFAIALVPILGLYYHFQLVFRRVNREVKRFDSTSRSPLFAHFAESLSGLPTIRAYAQEGPFILTNEDRMDTNNRFYFLVAASQRWLGTRLEALGACIICATALIATSSAGSIAPGLAGLSLSYAMQVTNWFSFMLRQTVESENFMNSVERSKFYTNGITHEAPTETEFDKSVSPEWPRRGDIRFTNASMRYREGLKLVLDHVSFNIAGGERIGIVGRTGAGKSTLMVTLFRLVELASGSIELDGVDISKLGLDKLRRSMAIIPQDPVLYSGTVRTNLDPFNEYSDEAVWDVLRKAHLDDAVSRLEGGLLSVVSENGDNFSVGQRCQICLARAMLKNARVLIMDEATASVDMETDALIQSSLRTHFNGVTILTIAHRLATIMDYDRVMTMSFGQLAEFDTPANLLRKGPGESLLAALVAESGPQTAELLQKLAFDAEAVAQGRADASLGLSNMSHVLHNRDLLRESSVSRRRPHSRAPVPLASDYAEAAEAADFAPPREDALDEQSLVRFHEAHGGGGFDDEEEEEQMERELARARGEDDAERRELLLRDGAAGGALPQAGAEQVRIEMQ